MGTSHGPGPNEGTPLVQDGVIYIVNPGDVLQSVDATNGDLIWEFRWDVPEDLADHTDWGLRQRNIAIYEGEIYHWPIVVGGMLISGEHCRPSAPCREDVASGLIDARTGEELWRTFVPARPDEPGGDTWGGLPLEQRRHSSTWIPGSHDLELDLIYWGTAVPAPSPRSRAPRSKLLPWGDAVAVSRYVPYPASGMRPMRTTAFALLTAATLASSASAQLIAAENAEIAMGHHHLRVSDVEAHKRFWVDGLGATPVMFGTWEVMKMPDLLVYLTPQAPTGGTKGTVVNHIGVQVRNVRAVVDRLQAAGWPIITAEELPGREVVDGLHWASDQSTHVAFVMAPDEVKVELFENKSLGTPIANHHIHFATDQVEAMRAWYIETFGAVGARRGDFEAADLPGVILTWSRTPTAPLTTKGRALDHIGFEIRDLEAFARKLESQGVKFDRPYGEARPGVAIAFLTDPWGTYIELTEGLVNQ